MAIKKVIYRDSAGNKLCLDSDGKLAVRNNKGQIVTKCDAQSFMKQKAVRDAVSKKLKLERKSIRVGTRKRKQH